MREQPAAANAVVHLVWGPLGVEPLRAFLRSYHAHDAGAPHELVVVFNGVPRGDADRAGASAPARADLTGGIETPGREAFLAELEDTPHRLIELERPVQDLAAYALLFERLEHSRLCFLNSYSEILSADWLAKLDHALDQPQAGLVGATGSWASVHSGVLHALFLPNQYRGVLPPKKVAREQFREIELERNGRGRQTDREPPRRSLARAVLATLKTFPAMPEQLLRFESFPAHHLRTNAFMAERSILQNLRLGRIERKMDAYLLENGRNSFTRQVQRMGLRTLVVARDGSLYDQERWPLSRTFWQCDQEGLLIADNQTRSYANGGIDRRRLLSAFAWGEQADPRLPTIKADREQPDNA
jgi:hypothetical protein